MPEWRGAVNNEYRLIAERNAAKQRIYDLRMALERLCAAIHATPAVSIYPVINHAFAEAIATLQDEPKAGPASPYVEEGE